MNSCEYLTRGRTQSSLCLSQDDARLTHKTGIWLTREAVSSVFSGTLCLTDP